MKRKKERKKLKERESLMVSEQQEQQKQQQRMYVHDYVDGPSQEAPPPGTVSSVDPEVSNGHLSSNSPV